VNEEALAHWGLLCQKKIPKSYHKWSGRVDASVERRIETLHSMTVEELRRTKTLWASQELHKSHKLPTLGEINNERTSYDVLCFCSSFCQLRLV
jgi:hypothetical protein